MKKENWKKIVLFCKKYFPKEISEKIVKDIEKQKNKK